MFSYSTQKIKKVRDDQVSQVQGQTQQLVNQQENKQIINQAQQNNDLVQQQNIDNTQNVQETVPQQNVNTQQQAINQETVPQQTANTQQQPINQEIAPQQNVNTQQQAVNQEIVPQQTANTQQQPINQEIAPQQNVNTQQQAINQETVPQQNVNTQQQTVNQEIIPQQNVNTQQQAINQETVPQQNVNTQQQAINQEIAPQQPQQATEQNNQQVAMQGQQEVVSEEVAEEVPQNNAQNVNVDDIMTQNQINQIAEEISQVQTDIPKEQIQEIVQQVAQKEKEILSEQVQQQPIEQPSLTEEDKENIAQQISENIDLAPQKVQQVVSQILDAQHKQNEQEVQPEDQQITQPGSLQESQPKNQQEVIPESQQKTQEQIVEEISQQIAEQVDIPVQTVQQLVQQIKQKTQDAFQQEKEVQAQAQPQLSQEKVQQISQDIAQQENIPIQNADRIVEDIIQKQKNQTSEQKPQSTQQTISQISQEISEENHIPVEQVEKIVEQVIEQQEQKLQQEKKEKEAKKSPWEKMREEMYPPFGLKCNRFHRCLPFYKCKENKCVLEIEKLNREIKSLDKKREEKHERERLAKRRERFAFILNNEKEEQEEIPDQLKTKEELAIAIKKREENAKLRGKKQQQQQQQKQINPEDIKREVTNKLANELHLPPSMFSSTIDEIYDLLMNHKVSTEEALKKLKKEKHLPEKNAKTLIDLLLENANKVYINKAKEMKLPTIEITPLTFEPEFGFVDREKVKKIFNEMKNGKVPENFAQKMSIKHDITEKQAQTLIDIIKEELDKEPVKEYGFVDKEKVKKIFNEMKNGKIPEDFAKKMSEKHDIPEKQAQTLIDIINEELNKEPVKEYGFVDREKVKKIFNEMKNGKVPEDFAKKMSEKHDIPEKQAQTLIDIINEELNKEPVKEYEFVDKEKIKKIYDDVKKGENQQDLSKKESEKLNIPEKDAQTVIDLINGKNQKIQPQIQEETEPQIPQQQIPQQQIPQQQEQQEDEYKPVKGLFTVINGLGNCGFSNIADFDDLYTGVTMDIYNNGDACGGCMKVKGPDGEVKVRVADSNGGGEKTLTLSKKAFGMIYHGESGEIPEIQYKWVDCGSEDNIKFEVINGANEWYMGIRPLNANKRVVKMEIYDNNFDEWRQMEKRGDFAFIAQPKDGKLISLPYKLRLTSAEGKVIEDTLNEFQSGKVYDGNTQF
jgi:hypothetical protein